MRELSLSGQMEEATQVSGSKDLQSSEEFSQAGCGQLEAIRPREGRASGVLPRSFAGNENSGGGQNSPIQPGKMKPGRPSGQLLVMVPKHQVTWALGL